MPAPGAGLQPFGTLPVMTWAGGPGWYGPRRWCSAGKQKDRDQPPFFLFFSGAAGGQFNRRVGPAPLKNKKKEGGWQRWCYKQATPTGFERVRVMSKLQKPRMKAKPERPCPLGCRAESSRQWRRHLRPRAGARPRPRFARYPVLERRSDRPPTGSSPGQATAGWRPRRGRARPVATPLGRCARAAELSGARRRPCPPSARRQPAGL